MDLGQVVHVEGLVGEHRRQSSGTTYEPEQVLQSSRPVVYVALMHSTVAVAVVMSSCVLLEKTTLLPMLSVAPARYMAPPPDTGEELSMKLTESLTVTLPPSA